MQRHTQHTLTHPHTKQTKMYEQQGIAPETKNIYMQQKLQYSLINAKNIHKHTHTHTQTYAHTNVSYKMIK